MEPLLGLLTVKREQVASAWRKYKRAASLIVARSVFHCEGIRESHSAAQLYLGIPILTFDPNGHVLVSEYCTGVFARVLDSQGYFSRLDEEFPKLGFLAGAAGEDKAEVS